MVQPALHYSRRRMAQGDAIRPARSAGRTLMWFLDGLWQAACRKHKTPIKNKEE